MSEIIKGSHAAFVNLDHRKDRLAKMEAELDRVGIDAVRQPGYLPKDCHYTESWVRRMRNRTPGAIGCWRSQVEIMSKAWGDSSHPQHAFVMEDDLVFCDDFEERMLIVDEFLEGRKWDVLWLGGTFHVNPPYWHKPKDAERTDHPRFMRTFGAFSTHAYIVNKSSLPRVMTLLDEYIPISDGIDHAFIQFQKQIQCFAFVPGCIIQYDNQSDIGNGMTHFSGFKKLGPYWFQRKMEEFNPEAFDWKEAK